MDDEWIKKNLGVSPRAVDRALIMVFGLQVVRIIMGYDMGVGLFFSDLFFCAALSLAISLFRKEL